MYKGASIYDFRPEPSNLMTGPDRCEVWCEFAGVGSCVAFRLLCPESRTKPNSLVYESIVERGTRHR
jgi:hypothetical protein